MSLGREQLYSYARGLGKIRSANRARRIGVHPIETDQFLSEIIEDLVMMAGQRVMTVSGDEVEKVIQWKEGYRQGYKDALKDEPNEEEDEEA